MATHAVDGLMTRPSHHSVDETLERLGGLLRAKGITIFALVDHGGEAAKVSMTMRPTKLLIFGNPKSGTPAMLASPSIAIDLWVSYNSPAYLQTRHHLPAELVQNIAVVETLVTTACA
jgi:uncharacterized protein (DUF302 family)